MSGIKNRPSFPPALMIRCASCSASMRLLTHQRAYSICCDTCEAYNVYDRKDHITTSSSAIRKFGKATFKIGTVFTIEPLEYVLLNYVVKEEQAYQTVWIEYTLFHPVEGCLTLSESDGHYNLMKPSTFYDKNYTNSKVMTVPSVGTFQLYSKYNFKIRYAAGEFFEDISTANLPSCRDYVFPPYILSCEKTADEISWFLGEYIDRKTLSSWLKEPVVFPAREGVGPSQPYRLNFSQTALARLTVISLLLLVLSQGIISNLISVPKTVSKQTFLQADSVTKGYVSSPFEIDRNHTAVDFKLYANLTNNWLETDFTLINETTGDQYYFGGVMEHYSGYTDGENWEEGSENTTITVSNLTKGIYHFNVEATHDQANAFNSFTVTVTENITLWSNFWIAAVCLILFPVYIYYRKKRFEIRQWRHSDYSPYHID